MASVSAPLIAWVCSADPMVAVALAAVVRPDKAVTTLVNVKRVARPTVWVRVVVQMVVQAVVATVWSVKAVTSTGSV